MVDPRPHTDRKRGGGVVGVPTRPDTKSKQKFSTATYCEKLMNDPPEPSCPLGRKPHRERVVEIEKILEEGQIASIAIDNTPEHRAWYLHELTKYPRLTVVSQRAILAGIVYIIKVKKGPSTN